ncbi:MAG: methionyl-tRNA formyltransferase [Anaerolineales bacterium]
MARVVFMGSPEFALPTLKALASHHEVAGVVTQPDRPAGRGKKLSPLPVKMLAERLEIPVIQPVRLKEPEAVSQLRDWDPEAIVVAAFGQILRQEVLDLPKYGCINVHASLLPRWRGASPIQAAILHGDKETGVTIMLMDAGLDTGPILSQRATRIKDDDTAGSLSEKLAGLGAKLLIETLPDYFSGKLQPRPQPSKGVTNAPLLKKADGELDLHKSARELERQVRAFNLWPGPFTMWNGSPLKIHRAHALHGHFTEPGLRIEHEGKPAISTGNGLLILDELQPAGKKAMSGDQFLRGARDWKTRTKDKG